MQAPPPPLLPLLRSRLQAELLTLVLLSPGREWTLTELAGHVGASVATAQREVDRAEQTGIISSRRLGNARLVTVAESPLTDPLTELLLRSFGPRQVVAEEFASINGVAAAYLHGAWAARHLGNEGPTPHAIDVLLVGRPSGAAVDAAIRRASARLARNVYVTVRSQRWWDNHEITGQPLVRVTGEPASTGSYGAAAIGKGAAV